MKSIKYASRLLDKSLSVHRLLTSPRSHASLQHSIPFQGKNILWPNPRRAAQLTLLAIVAQIAFVVYIITLNSILNAVPTWFGKFVDVIKSGDFKLPSL